MLFLLYKIVVHKNEIQKCKYLGHVSFIDHVWCFLYSKLFCKCASMLEYVLEYYAWKLNRLWVCFQSFSNIWFVRKLTHTLKLNRAGALRQTYLLIWPKLRQILREQLHPLLSPLATPLATPLMVHINILWMEMFCFIFLSLLLII